MTKENSSRAAIPRGCPVDKVLRLLSGHWTTHILWVLSHNGPTRHGELRRLVDGISSKVLTDRLKMLQTENIIFRDYEPTVPPKVTYGLTETGRQLERALNAMQEIALEIA